MNGGAFMAKKNKESKKNSNKNNQLRKMKNKINKTINSSIYFQIITNNIYARTKANIYNICTI